MSANCSSYSSCEIGGSDDSARRVHETHVQRQHVAISEERFLVRRDGMAVFYQ